jgi:GUN4-like
MDQKQRQPDNLMWERRAGLVLAFAVVIVFIYFVIVPPTESSLNLAIIRFLAALSSGLSAYLFLGSLGLETELPSRRGVIRATGAFAVFIAVFFLFLYGIPSSQSLLNEDQSTPIKDAVMLVSLSSERSIDYSQLRTFLAKEEWKEANVETLKLMLRTVNRESEGYMTRSIMAQFPCKDLLTIEDLWSTASSGKFGFRVQQEVWNGLGGPKYRFGNDPKVFEEFIKAVGWDHDIEYSINAPLGHLPVFSSGAKLGGIPNTYRVIECAHNRIR